MLCGVQPRTISEYAMPREVAVYESMMICHDMLCYVAFPGLICQVLACFHLGCFAVSCLVLHDFHVVISFVCVSLADASRDVLCYPRRCEDVLCCM